MQDLLCCFGSACQGRYEGTRVQWYRASGDQAMRDEIRTDGCETMGHNRATNCGWCVLSYNDGTSGMST